MWRTSILVTSARLGGAGIAILTQLLVARTVGAEGLGAYYLALSALALLSMFGSLGLPWIVPGIVAEQGEKGTNAHGLFALARREAGMASLGLTALALGFVWLLPFVAADLRWPLTVAIVAVPATTQMRMNGALANAQRRFVLAYLPELLLRPLLVFVAAVVWMFVAPLWAVPGVLAVNLLATAGLGLGQNALLHAGQTEHSGAQARRAARPQYAQHRRAALPMVAATLFLAIFADLDIMIAGLFLDAHHLGLFSAALRISMFVGFFIQAGHQIVVRDLADAFLAKDNESLRVVIGKTNWINLAVSGGALIGTVLAGPFVLSLFGPDFVSAYPILVVLVAAQMVRAAMGPGVQVLAIVHQTGRSAPVFVAAALVLFAGNGLLIPLWGMMGAALAVIVTTLLWTLWVGILATQAAGAPVWGLTMRGGLRGLLRAS